MGTKLQPIPGLAGAEIVDFAKYRKAKIKAIRKPKRKKAPTYELMICENCGSSDFKFVCASDVDALRHSIICTFCQQQPSRKTLDAMYELVTQQMVRR